MAGDLDFTVDMTGFDRHSFLLDAAQRLDNLTGYLGPGDADAVGGEIARALDRDIAQFGPYPIVHRVTAEQFRSRDGQKSQAVEALSAKNGLYHIEFPITLWPRYSWSFDRLEVHLRFDHNDVDHPELLPRILEILPNKSLVTLASFSEKFTVKLQADLHFSVEPVKAGTPPVSAETALDASSDAKTALAIGPFDYTLRRATIDHSPPGTHEVFWRLDDAKLLEDDVPRLLVVVGVPNATRTVYVDAALQAYRNYNFLSDRPRHTIQEAPKAIRNYFQKGAPLRNEARYDLSQDVTDGGGSG